MERTVGMINLYNLRSPQHIDKNQTNKYKRLGSLDGSKPFKMEDYEDSSHYFSA